jgi:hypothetical protein
MRCCICGNEILANHHGWAGGHNAAPIVMDGRCCEECNYAIVQLARVGAIDIEGIRDQIAKRERKERKRKAMEQKSWDQEPKP